MTKYFASPGEFADFLRGLQATLPTAEERAMDTAAILIQSEARAVLEPLAGSAAALGTPGRGTATRARTLGGDDIERSVRGRTAVVGVPEGPAGDAAVSQEFGEIDQPPEPILARAAFTHGEAAAMRAGEIVGRHIAGWPPLPRRN